MRIKLIHLPCDNRNALTGRIENGSQIPPLGIATLTSALRAHGISVDQDDLDIKVVTQKESGKDIINMTVFGDERRVRGFIEHKQDEVLEAEGEHLLRLTSTSGYDLIGLSITKADTLSSAAVAMVLGKLLKAKHGCRVLLGGTMHQDVAMNILSTGFVDYRIVGNSDTAIGEINLLDFCRAWEDGSDLRGTRGVQYFESGKFREKGSVYSDEERYTLNVPDFKGLPIDLYRRTTHFDVEDARYTFKELILPFFFIRGCPHKCAFCMHSRGDSWRGIDPADVAEHLHHLSHKYRTRYFLFHNPLVNPTHGYAESLTDEIQARGVDIRWSDCATLVGLDRPLLQKLRRAGATRLVFGFESASPRLLRYIRKPVSVPKAATLLKAAHEMGLWVDLDLICGFPYEQPTDVDATCRFLEQHREYIMSCMLHKFCVDGEFYHSPDEYRIEWRRTADALHSNWSSYEFDEVDGLKWNERQKITNETYGRLRALIDKTFVPARGAPELFFYSENPLILNALKEGRIPCNT